MHGKIASRPQQSLVREAVISRRSQNSREPRIWRTYRPLVICGAAIFLLSVNLRLSITSLPPIFPELSGRLDLSSAAISLLAALPVFAFAISAMVTPIIRSRIGEDRLVSAAMVLVTLSIIVRALIPAAILPTTASAAFAIGAVGAAIPSLARRHGVDSSGPLLSVYLVGLYAGAITGGASSIPIYNSSGRSIPAVLGIWAVPAALALFVWLLAAPRLGQEEARPSWGAKRPIGRFHLAWIVSAFMGIQSLLYYATLSWLPSLLRDRGATPEIAGFLAATVSIGGLAAAWAVPVVAQKSAGQARIVIVAVALTVLGLVGVAVLPLSGAIVWTIALGAGQGAAIGLAMVFTIARTSTADGAASLSGMSQGVGYMLAGFGPLAAAMLHYVTRSWTDTFLLLVAAAGVELIIGMLAARPVRLDI
jgi:MFS transporter, CP family, cyanate transporter